MKLKMQSEQESVLESFMERSFGAPFLFLPDKLKTGRDGKNEQESADLAWINDDFVVLFYMQAGKNSLPDKIGHNLREAKKYRSRWSRDLPNFNLRGKNRFGESCYLTYQDVKRVAYVSVVSDECGIRPINVSEWNSKEIYLNVPQAFIHILSDFGGTIADFLNIVQLHLSLFSKFCPSSEVHLFNTLVRLSNEYVHSSFKSVHSISEATPLQDLDVIHSCIQTLKGPSSIRHTTDPTTIAQLAKVFGDMTFSEILRLTATAALIIEKSEPPEFKKCVVAKINGGHYNFVVATINLSAKESSTQVVNLTIEESKPKNGEKESIIFLYGDTMGVNDYRYPILFTLPQEKNLPPPQSNILFDKINASI